VKEYGRTLEERLRKVTRKLHEQTYAAQPIRRKWIPKADGGKRPLGIPEVEDRLVQAAIVRVIEPIYEGKFFEGSYGFRPERGAHNALEQLERQITTGSAYLVDADIRNCFGSIPHEKLMEEVGRELSDPKLLKLIRQFVEADIVEEMERWTPEEGTPQGAVLSPLLANIYLHEFDRQMLQAGYAVIRYADDFVVTSKTREEAERAKETAERILKGMGLELHPEKSRVIDTRESRFQFLGYEFWPRKGQRPGRQPRQSSTKKLHDAIRKKTPRRAGKALRRVIGELNPTLRGWFGYFRYSFYNVLSGVDGFVRRRLRGILRNRAGGRGMSKGKENSKYPNAYFEKEKLFSLERAHERDAERRRVGVRELFAFPAKA